jgi:predicted small secreted protein
MRPLTILALVVLAVVLAACAEREQTANGIKSDAAPFQDTNHPFVGAGGKPCDRNSWEQQMKVRTVQGQNEYAKVP